MPASMHTYSCIMYIHASLPARFLHILACFLQDLAKCKTNGPFLARMYKSCKDTLVRFLILL